MVRWLKWHCPPDTGFEIRALAVWGRARYLSVTETPHNTDFHTLMGKKQFCFFQTAETGNRTPAELKGSGANHYPRAPALLTSNAGLPDDRPTVTVPWDKTGQQTDDSYGVVHTLIDYWMKYFTAGQRRIVKWKSLQKIFSIVLRYKIYRV